MVKTLCERRTSCILLGKEEGEKERGRERERTTIEATYRMHSWHVILSLILIVYIISNVCVCNTVFYLIISFLYVLRYSFNVHFKTDNPPGFPPL